MLIEGYLPLVELRNLPVLEGTVPGVPLVLIAHPAYKTFLHPSCLLWTGR